MKKITLLITLLSFAASVFAQEALPHGQEYYLQKSKNQKTAAWVLLGVGTTMIVVGMVGGMSTFGSSDYPFISEEDASAMDTYGIIMFVGIAGDLASIPFFISAGKNKKRAAAVTISNQPLYLPHNGSIAVKYVPGITFKISLNR